jgi:hypothetical protein
MSVIGRCSRECARTRLLSLQVETIRIEGPMRFTIVSILLAAALCLQGCATSLQTFMLGGMVGAAAGISAVTCVVMCH